MTSANMWPSDVMAEQEAVAERFVGHWPPEILERIVRGKSFPGVLGYSLKRIAVFERAALIHLDVIRGQRPSNPADWSRESLENRIAVIKANRLTLPNALVALERVAETRERIAEAESRGARERKLELVEAERAQERLKAAQAAER